MQGPYDNIQWFTQRFTAAYQGFHQMSPVLSMGFEPTRNPGGRNPERNLLSNYRAIINAELTAVQIE